MWRGTGDGAQLSGSDERQTFRLTRLELRCERRARLELSRKHSPLTLRERPNRLHLADLVPAKELAAPSASPATLTHQQVSDRPTARFPGGVEDDFRGGYVTFGDPSLQVRACEPNLIGSLQSPQSLRRLRGHRGGLHHVAISLSNIVSAGHGRVDEYRRRRRPPGGASVGYCILISQCSGSRRRPRGAQVNTYPSVILAPPADRLATTEQAIRRGR
jgi:hypothetical protein